MSKTITIDNVDLTDTVESVKKKIFQREVIPPARQRLMFAGQLLADELSLITYKIPLHKPNLEMVFRQEAKLQVYFKTLTGKKFLFECDQNEPIESVKAEIQKKMGIPAMQQVVPKLANGLLTKAQAIDSLANEGGDHFLGRVIAMAMPSAPSETTLCASQVQVADVGPTKDSWRKKKEEAHRKDSGPAHDFLSSWSCCRFSASWITTFRRSGCVAEEQGAQRRGASCAGIHSDTKIQEEEKDVTGGSINFRRSGWE